MMSTRELRIVTILVTSYLVAAPSVAGPGSDLNSSPRTIPAVSHLDLPLMFEEGDAEAADDATFVSRSGKFEVVLSHTGATWVSRSYSGEPREVVRLRLEGSPGAKRIFGEGTNPVRTHYFKGANQGKWRTDVRNHSRVHIEQVYPGIDLVFYGNGRNLEYDFLVSPGADLSLINLVFEGTEGISIDGSGSLAIRTRAGEIRHSAPKVYQESEGERQIVKGAFHLLSENRVGFSVGSFDPSRTLVIDPVLDYSSYLGGSSEDLPAAVATDADGNLYILGSTGSTDFPLVDPFQDEFGGGGSPNGDVFVTKVDPSGTRIIYSTYIGGSGTDIGRGVAVDSQGQVVATGTTFSPNFPSTPGAYQTNCSGQCPFVVKLSADGSELVYSTFLGRGDGSAVVVDAQSQAVVTGRTSDGSFPSVNPFQNERGGGWDAFVSKLSADGSSLIYSSYLGGSGDENLNTRQDIAIDPAGNTYVVGRTNSDDFPVLNAVQSTLQGDEDAFVTKLTSQGTLVYSTYLGGTDDDEARGVVADAQGNGYVTGTTLSNDFPTANAFQTEYGGGVPIGDAFLAKIAPAGGSLVFSTYLGGDAGDIGTDVALDSEGRPVVVGNGSSNFPVERPIRNFDGIDNFVAKFSQDGSELVYSTPIGGGDQTISVATSGTKVLVAGNISSGSFPILKALQLQPQGGREGYLAQIADMAALYFAQFGNGGGGGISAVSDILLSNSSEATATNATLRFRGDDGQPLDLNVTVTDENGTNQAPVQNGELDVVVPPLGAVRVTTDGAGTVVVGSVTVQHDGPLGGSIRFRLTPFGNAGVGESELVRGFISPVRKNDVNTGVAIFNPEDRQVGVTMRLRNLAGEQVQGGLRVDAMDPGEHLAQFIDELFPNADLDEDFEGTITVEATTANALIAATTLEQGPNPGQFTTLPVTPIP